MIPINIRQKLIQRQSISTVFIFLCRKKIAIDEIIMKKSTTKSIFHPLPTVYHTSNKYAIFSFFVSKKEQALMIFPCRLERVYQKPLFIFLT
jgi:hypothetical protein